MMISDEDGGGTRPTLTPVKSTVEHHSVPPVVPSRWLAKAVVLASAVSAVLIWFLFDSFGRSRDALGQGLRLVELAGIITHLDEVLTMSARMGAATGDLAWERRYLKHESRLDRAIAETRSVVSDHDDLAAAGLTQEANVRLVSFEKAAFAHVRSGEHARASALLSGREYAIEKERYAEGMERVRVSMHSKVQERVQEEWWRLILSISGIAISLALLSLSLLLLRRSENRAYGLSLEASKSLRDSERARLETTRQSEFIKSSLLLSMAHDLRTPLAVLRTSLAAARDPAIEDDTRQELFASSADEIERLDLFTSNLLELSKLEVGTFEAHRSWHLLEDLVDEVLRTREVGGASRRVRVLSSLTTPAVRVDGLQIRLVLKNLVENAVKYSPPASPIVITISGDTTQVGVSVRSEGPGPDPEELPHVFEKFFRGRSARALGGRGSGLGLAISKGIIEAHRGSISMSCEASATIVTFTLPADPTALATVPDSPPKSIEAADYSG